MKIFKMHFSGHYLAGKMVIVAKSIESARSLAKKALKEEGLFDNHDFSPDNTEEDLVNEVKEISLEEEKAIILFNGDY